MLRTVEEVAIQLNVSKTSIYNKLKLKQFKSKVLKKQGKSMVDDDLFNLIKETLKVENKVENRKNENAVNEEISTDCIGSLKLNQEFNMDVISELMNLLKEKDKQIDELHKLLSKSQGLLENNQILLKQQQDKEINQLKLEEHFQEVDQKLMNLREKMESQKEEKKSFFNFFKK